MTPKSSPQLVIFKQTQHLCYCNQRNKINVMTVLNLSHVQANKCLTVFIFSVTVISFLLGEYLDQSDTKDSDKEKLKHFSHRTHSVVQIKHAICQWFLKQIPDQDEKRNTKGYCVKTLRRNVLETKSQTPQFLIDW